MASFRVIIVGGGIGGLTLANYLQHANIDFVLLESREEIGLNSVGGTGVSNSFLSTSLFYNITRLPLLPRSREVLFLRPHPVPS
jgi:flavin-dependent dehydrogenase